MGWLMMILRLVLLEVPLGQEEDDASTEADDERLELTQERLFFFVCVREPIKQSLIQPNRILSIAVQS